MTGRVLDQDVIPHFVISDHASLAHFMDRIVMRHGTFWDGLKAIGLIGINSTKVWRIALGL